MTARSGGPARGDGNGELDGSNGVNIFSYDEGEENLMFWEDLSTAGLIDGTFNSYVDGNNVTCSSASACNIYFPPAKIGGGNSVYTYSGYASNCPGGPCISTTGIGPNFFGLSVINAIGGGGNVNSGGIPPAPGLTAAQALNIDKKIDDGLPTTGTILAQYLTAAASGHPGWSTNGATPSASTCYDTSSGVAAYSTSYTGGSNINCGLSFQFQE